MSLIRTTLQLFLDWTNYLNRTVYSQQEHEKLSVFYHNAFSQQKYLPVLQKNMLVQQKQFKNLTGKTNNRFRIFSSPGYSISIKNFSHRRSICCIWPNVHLPPFSHSFGVNLNLFSLCYRETEIGTNLFLISCGGRIKA